ncbi:MAG TPA: aldo/keto reductase [Steroidobacteraceae bacterium]|nr:aldo/keto reductase [Steroidobacteraceae bacterium]
MARAADWSVTRRGFLAAGVATGVGVLCSGPLRSADPPTGSTAPTPGGPPITSAPTASQRLIAKAIPSSAQWLPAIGIGTDAFRNSVRAEIRAELKRMSELGAVVIDTSDDYGDSEALIGEALESLGLRDRMFLATKMSGGASRGSENFARSLERLRTRRVELLQVHNLNGTAELLPQMQRWKQEGRIRYLGVTTSRGGQHAELADCMRNYRLDFVQVDYSIANREAAETILPLALERKIAVLANLPFGRSSLFRQAAGRALPPWAADIDVASWAQYFLKYVIGHPAITCAIPGSTQLAHLEDNQGAAHGRLPDAALRRRMEEYWDARG